MAWYFKSTSPIYIQIMTEIKIRIFNGEYPPGTQLPTVRDLAQEASVNPNTVQRAFLELEDSGLIMTHRTAGRSVTDDVEVIRRVREETCRTAVESFIKEMSIMGLSKSDIVLALEQTTERS